MHKFICLLLILTFVVQPVLTLADVHQFHQSGAEHLSFDHDDQTTDKLTRDKNSATQFDCHHCCHCHGAACGVGLPVTLILECEYGVPVQTDDYVVRVYPAIYEKQFRPPRV